MKLHYRWPLRTVAEKIREHQFFAAREWRGMHLGVFPSFEEARRFCRDRGIKSHYSIDHQRWLTVQSQIRLHDYPVILWLTQILAQHARIGDLGGSVGVSYYALRSRLPPASITEWTVCELPEAVELGRELARERGATNLHFTTSPENLDGHDVWLAAGAIQFIETPLWQLLGNLKQPPRHVLINRIPVHATKDFVTLQNTGLAISPCHVFAASRFEDELQRIGYDKVDEWPVTTHAIHVPLHPEHRVGEFRGYYFQRRDAGASINGCNYH